MGGRLYGLHGRQDARSIELNEHLWHLVDGGRKANTILIAVMHCVVELHEYVTEDVHLLQALLVDAERLDNVATLSSVRISFVDLTSDPVMRRHVIFYSIDDIGEVGERELVAFLARDDIAVVGLEDIVVRLGEGC